ncbi:glycosyltransferase, partial [Streptococcus hyovaginalis]
METLTLVIPCYGEEETILPFLEETQKIEQALASEVLFDYIFVNDGSKDNTLTVLRDVSKRYINVQYLSLSRNFGKE